MAKAKKGKKSSFFIRFLLVLNSVFILCLITSYISPYISPAKYWVLAFFGLAYPIWLVINLFFLVLWIILFRKFAWVCLLAIVLGFNHILAIFPIQIKDHKTVPHGAIKIISFNVHSLYGISNKSYTPKMRSKVTEFLTEQKPDIFCVQEFFVKSPDSSKVIERFTKEIGCRYFTYTNYQEIKDHTRINALAIFSKYPIVSNGYIKASDRSTFCVFADIVVNGVKVRVYDLHLESIKFGNEDYSFYAHLTEKDSTASDISTGSKKIVTKLKKAFTIRANQVDMLKHHMSGSPYPLIVCGDFNDPPNSYAYQVLSTRLKDSFIQAGKGLFGGTYAGSFPSFRIDYILTDKSFDIFNYQSLRVGLSDHYPVSAFIRLNPGDQQ
jgi:endonuclease/exonuclease/phosphatase family metal-dependent hydrolase